MDDNKSADELLEQIGDQPILSGPSDEPASTNDTPPAQTDSTEPKTEEPKEADANTATDDTKDSTPASDTETETSDQEEQTAQTADDRRREQARQGWLRRQQEKEAAQNYDSRWAPKDANDLIEEGLDPRDAEIEALKLQRQFDNQRAQVIQLNADMASDAIEIENDFDVFNSKSPNYDKEFAESVMQDYREDAHLEVDDQGNILRADRPLYDYIQRRYNSYTRGLSKGSVVSQQNHQDMLARTENPGGSSSQAPTDISKLSAAELLERIGDAPLFG